MDSSLPDEIMDSDDVVRQWQNKNNWEERGWNQDLEKESNSFYPFSEDLQEANKSFEESLPKVGDCVYIEWADEESSDEAPGWYFGTIDAVTSENNFTIVYADGAEEVLDLSNVKWVRAKPGSKFYSATRPKPFLSRSQVKTTPKSKEKTKKSKVPLPPQQKEIHELTGEDLLSPEMERSDYRTYDAEKSDKENENHNSAGEQELEKEEELDKPSGETAGVDEVQTNDLNHAEEGEEALPLDEKLLPRLPPDNPEDEGEGNDIQGDMITLEEHQEMEGPAPPAVTEEEEEVHDGREVVLTGAGGEPTRYIEAGNILIPTTLAARHSNQQIILVQRGPNGELQEVQPQTTVVEEAVSVQATIIEEEIEVEAQIGHIEEEHDYVVEDIQEGSEQIVEEEEDDDDSHTEIVYPEDVEDEEEEDGQKSYSREYVDENGNLQRTSVQLIRRITPSSSLNHDVYLPPHTTEQVERYDGRIISSEQMMMGSQETTPQYRERDMMRSGRGSDIENYQRYDVDNPDDLDRLQGDDDDEDDYSGDDEADPRMPRRRGKYTRKTPEELDQVPRPWSCEFCPRAFPNKYHLQIHLRTHTGEKPYRCTECDMAFSHSSNLCSHIRTHNGIKPYKCKHCGKEFGRSNNMKAHTRIHTGEKPFECRFCGKAFRFGNHLTIHERSHTGERPYKCTYCDRAFRNSSNLRTHERLHTDERPYRCRYCDRAFSGSGNLHAHERVHTGERPFVCDVCHKAFSQSSTLRIHQRIHTGDKRYQCSLCGRRFIQSNHLKTHLRRMHHIDDSLPSIRTMHKNPDPYGIEPINPNNFRVVAKQEPEDDPFDRDMHKSASLIKRELHSSRPGPLVVDDDVSTKSWLGSTANYLNHSSSENRRMHN